MLTFNTDGMVNQRFPFPAPIMDYIFKHLQPHHLLKLYKTCKFYYAKFGLNIIRNLTILDDGEEETLDPANTTICISNPALEKIKDFWISDSFVYHAPLNIDVMPEFSHCTIKKLESCCYLYWQEYEALTKAGTIEELKIARIHRDGNNVPVDRIIAQIPNAASIEITESIITSTTFSSLATLNHQAKITKFVLRNIDSPDYCNLDLIFEFLKKHAAVDCTVHLDFMLLDYAHIEALRRMGTEYTELLAAKLKEAKKNLALQE